MIRLFRRHWIKFTMMASALVAGAFVLNSCVSVPEGISPIQGIEKKNYLGKWYEIARFDHRFERGLSNVSAEYSLREDSGIKVLNRGFNARKNEWTEAEGKAYFVKDDATGHLKVSFFGPFYASYVIFGLDKNDYQYSYVSGYNRDYLWLLSRKPVISKAEKNAFIKRAKELGFDTDKLLFIDQAKNAK